MADITVRKIRFDFGTAGNPPTSVAPATANDGAIATSPGLELDVPTKIS